MIEAVMIARAVENICKSRQKLRINEWHKEVRIRDIRRAGDRSAIGSAYFFNGRFGSRSISRILSPLRNNPSARRAVGVDIPTPPSVDAKLIKRMREP
jgi:hypothetical protein